MTFALTSHTDDYFAWPIAPEISGAFLGACYLAATVLLGLSSRAINWVDGRLAALPVIVISLLLLIATLVHWEKFDQDHLVFWLWLAAYVLVPPLLLFLVLRQRQVPGDDPPPEHPLPAWARVGLAGQAAVMVTAGSLLFFAPSVLQDSWPWELTPLTSRAMGAFVFGFGLAAVVGFRENDLDRLRAPAYSYAVFGLAALIAVARYADQFEFDLVGGVFLVFVATVLASGGLIATMGRNSRRVG